MLPWIKKSKKSPTPWAPGGLTRPTDNTGVPVLPLVPPANQKNTTGLVDQLARQTWACLVDFKQYLTQHYGRNLRTWTVRIDRFAIGVQQDDWNLSTPISVASCMQTLTGQLNQAVEELYPRPAWQRFIRRSRTWGYAVLGTMGVMLGLFLAFGPLVESREDLFWGAGSCLSFTVLFVLLQWPFYHWQQVQYRWAASFFVRVWTKRITHGLDTLAQAIPQDHQPPPSTEDTPHAT